jgi:hypothetical protein
MKAPSPKADAQRALGEANRERRNATATPARKKLIPYAGKEKGAREDLMGNTGQFAKDAKKARKS